MVIIPTSFIMTERNHGEFMLLSNDIMRIALVNHGNLRGTVLPLPDQDWEYVVQSPSTIQKDFHEMRHIDLEKDNVVAQNIDWVLSHPFQAFVNYLERTADYVYGTLPFPTYYGPFRSLTYLSQLLMLFLVYVPAVAWVMQARKRSSGKEYLSLFILLLPLVSLPLVALISVTETRYLHPFVPFLIVPASAWYHQKFKAH